MAFTPLIGTLMYLWDRETDQLLLIRRDARADDDHFGKVNGLGGKVEPDEDIASSARRELYEEAGVTDAALTLRGTITFTDFGPKREQWLIFVFVVDEWTGTPIRANHEGHLEWADRHDVLAACGINADQAATVHAAQRYPMWPGDKHFLPLVFDDDPRVFHGTMPYDADQPLRWSFVRA